MITVEDIGTSGGKHKERLEFFTRKHRDMASILCDRINALFVDLGVYVDAERINEGFRLQWAKYGAKNSWHKRGGAVDLRDPGNQLAHKITRAMLTRFRLRREDTDCTPTWCHLDIGEPYGVIFKP